MSPRITPEAETEELRTVVRDFLARHGDTTAVFREMDGDRGWDPAVWQRFAVELGAAALDVPEDLGGAGAGFREVAVVAEELGRSLIRLPWFPTAVLGVGALLHVDPSDDLREKLLADLAHGRTATVAFRDTDRAGGEPGTTAVPDGAGGWRLTGAKTLVVEGATAELLLITARTDDGEPAVFAVEADADGLARTPMRALDPNRQLADLTLEGVPARGLAGPAADIVDRVRDRALAALACEQAGGAAAALDLAVTHAGQRVQFGRPIGTFQAIKHRCADMAVRVEEARSAAWWAAATHADEPERLPLAAAAAALACGDAYSWVAAETVQVHGGIGFTWEHPAHLHVRRAATSAVLLGDARSHRERLLGALGLP